LLLAGIIVLTAQHAGAQVEHTSKDHEGTISQPAGLSKPMGYTQVVVAQSGKLLHFRGQLPLNASAKSWQGDLRAQLPR